jgi:hypothetical protein
MQNPFEKKKEVFNEIPVHKTILAKLFAKENISVVHADVKTAMFDTKNRTMYLPYWKDLTLEMYDMLTSHETGHALDTPQDAFHQNKTTYKGPIRAYLNIVEDARIEKLQLRRYPGLKDSYVSAYNDLHARNFFQLKDKEDLRKRYLIDRLNLYFKLGRWGIVDVPFMNQTEQDFLKRVSLAETFDEVKKLAHEIMEYDKHLYKSKKQDESEDGDGEGEGQEGNGQKKKVILKKGGKKDPNAKEISQEEFDRDYEVVGEEDGDGEGDGSEEGDDGEGAGEGEGEGEGKGDKEGKGKGKGEGEGKGDGEGEGKGKAKGKPDFSGKQMQDGGQPDKGFGRNKNSNVNAAPPSGPSNVSDTEFEKNANFDASDKAYHDAVEKLISNGGAQEVIFVNLPKLNSDDFTITSTDVIEIFEKHIRTGGTGAHYYGQQHNPVSVEAAAQRATVIYTAFRQRHLNAVNFLIKEFEMRKAADEHKRTQTTKMGDLNMSKLTQYKFNDDIFRRADLISEGKSHALVMLLDMSGSMQSIFYKTMEQLLILVEFCHRMNIPFEVYGFSDQGAAQKAVQQKRHTRSSVKLNAGEVQPGNPDRMALMRLIDSSLSAMQYRKLMGYLLSYAFGMSGGGRGNGKSDDHNMTVGGTTVHMSGIPEFGLCGTPLIEAMYLMPDLISKFKKKSGAQIIHFFNLTDGFGGAIYSYIAVGGQHMGYNQQANLFGGTDYNTRRSTSRSKIVFNDLDSRKMFEYTFNKNQQATLQSNAYVVSMNLLSERIRALGCNVININLLMDKREGTVSGVLGRSLQAEAFFRGDDMNKYDFSRTEEYKKAIKQYESNGFVAVTSKIYTHEFFMNANVGAEERKKFDSLAFREGQSTGQMAGQVTEAMKAALNTRQLAIEFSKLIAR